MSDQTKRIIKAAIAIVISGIYLINPTAGLAEFIPDVIPVVGNLDEVAATTLLLYGLRELGVGRRTVVIDNH